ncbi:unnamed protein product [Rhizophagus irregularis]|nr:unnamed protein product [Rhizophagus irregularis]
MDSTFKTVPTSFKQLYTIHESVESSENSQIMPLVFSLISTLAFLPCNNIPAAFDELRSNMPLNMLPEVNKLLDWFEIYYIYEKVIHRLRNGNVVCFEPLFPPSL